MFLIQNVKNISIRNVLKYAKLIILFKISKFIKTIKVRGRASVSFLEFDVGAHTNRRLRREPIIISTKTARHVRWRLSIGIIFPVLYFLHELVTDNHGALCGWRKFNMVPAVLPFFPCGAGFCRVAHFYRILLLPMYVLIRRGRIFVLICNNVTRSFRWFIFVLKN